MTNLEWEIANGLTLVKDAAMPLSDAQKGYIRRQSLDPEYVTSLQLQTVNLWSALARIKTLADPHRPWAPKETLEMIYAEACGAINGKSG